MPMSPAVAMGLGAVALGVVAHRANRARQKSAGGEISSESQQVLDLLIGPPADPCLNAYGPVYTEIAQPLLPEIYANVGEQAQLLYGERPVFFIPQQIQGETFVRIATLRVNEPFVEPVLKVAQELAPQCKWLLSRDHWSPSMVAFHNSLEKMVQIVDVDMGDVPELKRPHAWETEMVLRDGRELALADGSTVAFELPTGPGQMAVTANVSPADAGSILTLGVHDQKVPDGLGGYKLIQVIQLQPTLGGSASARFRITATRASGQSTVGVLEIAPKV